MDSLYDVAISFLSGDEPLAVQLHNALSENLKVFVYSKKQEQLAGRDGLEAFRQAFFSQSRLLVVLYRDGWGKTKWTAIEELAIKDRLYNGGWDSLLFVMLDEQSTPPLWLPKTHIRLNYTRFADDLVGAIKLRALELGSKLTPETALEKAQRMESIALARRQRSSKLTYLELDVVAAEWQTLCRLLDEKLAQIQPVLPSARVEHGSEHNGYIIRTSGAGVVVQLRDGSPASESEIVVRQLVGRLLLPKDVGHMHIPGNEPECVSTHEFHIDYTAALGWCWRSNESEDSEKPLLQATALSEHLIKQMVELHEQVASGKIVRRRQNNKRQHTQWS